MSASHDSMTVHDTDSLGPHCLCIAMHILDAFYRKSRHQPSLPTLKKGRRGKKGDFPALTHSAFARAKAGQ
jgi:hypothetical protein